jgi:hypothetical protein
MRKIDAFSTPKGVIVTLDQPDDGCQTMATLTPDEAIELARYLLDAAREALIEGSVRMAESRAEVPASVHERGWQWRPVSTDTAFAPPFGTIRVCGGCGCLVSGGPTRCGSCAKVAPP